MYELKVTSCFAAAHQLREFHGACENLHGHNWKVEVVVIGDELGEDGTLIDFRVIKEKTKQLLNQLDHQFLNELPPFREVNPSSENIARHIFEGLCNELNGTHCRVSKVTAWESDSACAAYREP